IDGVLTEVRDVPRLNPRQDHTIDLVVDRLVIREGVRDRLAESVETAVKHGEGTVIVTHADDGDWHDEVYSTRHACPNCGTTYGDLEPRLFSFNNPYGACPGCDGLGEVWQVDPALVLPDRNRTLARVLARLKEQTAGLFKSPVPDRLRALVAAFGG